MSGQYYEGIGRRKESTARVRIMQGEGKFIVNDKPLSDYFTRMGDAESIMEPFASTGENQAQYDVTVMSMAVVSPARPRLSNWAWRALLPR